MIRILVIFGTRPEAIKLGPVVSMLRSRPETFEVAVCVTAQHREMLDQVLSFFGIVPDFDLDVMQPDQTLFDITARSLVGLAPVFESFRPDCAIVQGDASSSFIGALAAYYAETPIAHIEAGLRSGNLRAPFPEEGNRILTGHLADFHFAPTASARENLGAEGIRDRVWVVGNTVIDALLEGIEIVRSAPDRYGGCAEFLNDGDRVVLVTAHRRESFGKPFREIARAIRDLSQGFPDVRFVYPVHLNPNVRRPVSEILADRPNVFLIDPVPYPELIWLLDRCYLVLTDSGGIQEEAPALGRPVVVMREVTERTEGVEAGTATLVGSDRRRIVETVTELLQDEDAYERMAQATNPYGDGTTSRQIADILERELK